MKKQNLMPVIVLTLIGVIVAGLLAVVNMFTEGVIADAENAAIQESLRQVMPDGEFGVAETLPDDAPKTVKSIYKEKNGKGHVVTLTSRGYASDISITVGVDADGKITKAIVTSEQESHGKGGMKNYTDNFTGLDAAGVESVELFSGATVSSTTIKNAIYDALVVLGYAKELEVSLPGLTDDAVETMVSTDYWQGATLKDVTPTGLTYVRKLYENKTTGNYIAYVVTIAAYGGGLETDGIVEMDKNGKILNVDMLTWTVGHDVECPDGYTDKYLGTDKGSVGDVELVAGATGTAKNFRDAVSEAVNAVADLDPKAPSMPDADALAEALKFSGAKELTDVTPNDTDSKVRKIYYDSVSKSFVVYVVTTAAYGGGVETQGFMVIKNGRVTKIELYSWKVGHDQEPGDDFAPSFVGATLDTVGDVELVAGATGTASNFRDAVGAALADTAELADVMPADNGSNGLRVLGGALVVLFLCFVVAVIVIDKNALMLKGGRK